MAADLATDGPSFLRRLEQAAASRSAAAGLVQISLPAPAGNPAQLLAIWPKQPAMAYGSVLGLGVAADLRLPELDGGAAARWAQDLTEKAAGQDLRILCGAAFDPRSGRHELWDGFPALYLLMPRWTWARHGAGATLTFTATPDALHQPKQREAAVAELLRLSACLEPTATRQAECLEPPRQLAPEAWEGLVRAALREIEVGRFQKLVLARSATARAVSDWNVAEIFRSLQGALDCTPFAVRLGRATFLGATPERLIELRDGSFHTDALAGTAPASRAADLLGSAKDLEEHRLVVDEIVRRLRPLSDSLEVAGQPRLRQLKELAHLHTPISGRIAGRAERSAAKLHLLDLALALHPTPAVGGLPGRAAVEWIREHEPVPRGWYAGFVGWFDGSGNGELSVAIRSGVVAGREACFYSGAGIVAGSDPLSEYLETALKQGPFLRSLGLESPRSPAKDPTAEEPRA